MLKTNKIILVLAVVLAATLSSCPNNKVPPPITVDPAKTIQGESGVELGFVVKSDSINVGDNVVLLLNIANKGAENVENGFLKIPNPYPAYLEISQNTPDFSVAGRSYWLPEGDKIQKEFQAHIKGVPTGNDFNFIIAARACYLYSTKFQANVCVDSSINPDNDIVEKVCSITDQTFSKGQGAPVAITKIEQKIRKTGVSDYSMEFKIFVENKGGGVVLKPDSDYPSLCESGTWRSEFDQITPQVYISSDTQLQCSPAVVDKYKPEQQYYICKGELNDPANANYVTILRAQLDYSYINAPVEAKLQVKSPQKEVTN